MTLSEYNKKRNFAVTSEPKGKKVKSKNNRFVVQFHRARRDHYDFRLEEDGVLISFALPKGFSYDSHDKRLAVHVEDHPLEYFNFEGRIPKGEYGAGTVEVFDKGRYEADGKISKGIERGEFKVTLYGEKLKGRWAFVHFKEDNFLAICENGEIKKEQKKKLPFYDAPVQLASLTKRVPSGKNYIFEIKYDGYRVLSYIEKGKVKLKSRNGKDFTKKFAVIAEDLEKSFKNKAIVLDGEVVVFDKNGRSDFSMLQDSVKKGKNNFSYVVFDILALGEDTRSMPLLERKKLLEALSKFFTPNIILSEYVLGNGKECFEVAKRLGLEGVVAKKIDSKYGGTRNDDWLKIKCYHRQEFVVGGYSLNDGQLASLLLGYYEGDNLIYVGKVGTGFSESLKKELERKLSKIKTKISPFSNCQEKEAVFVVPKYVAEVQYAEITRAKLLRQASFIAFRTDKHPKEVVLEEE